MRSARFIVALSSVVLLLAAVLLPQLAGATHQHPIRTKVINQDSAAMPVRAPSPLRVTETREPALRPFSKRLDFIVPVGSFSDEESFTVPSGRRLVIEFISGFGKDGTSGQDFVFGTIRLTTNGQEALFGFETTRTADVSTFVTSDQLRLYADPGTEVRLLVQRTGSTGPSLGEYHLSLSGYFVSV